MPMDSEADTFRRVGFWESSVKASSKWWAGAKHRKTITVGVEEGVYRVPSNGGRRLYQKKECKD
jgi:hypothetical protein